jgi:hypothetical protein
MQPLMKNEDEKQFVTIVNATASGNPRGYSSQALTDGTDGAGNPILTALGSLQSPDGRSSNIPYGSQLNAPGMAGLKAALAAAVLSGIGSAGFAYDGAGSEARPYPTVDLLLADLATR